MATDPILKTAPQMAVPVGVKIYCHVQVNPDEERAQVGNGVQEGDKQPRPAPQKQVQRHTNIPFLGPPRPKPSTPRTSKTTFVSGFCRLCLLKAQNDQDAVRMPINFAKQPGCCQDAVRTPSAMIKNGNLKNDTSHTESFQTEVHT